MSKRILALSMLLLPVLILGCNNVPDKLKPADYNAWVLSGERKFNKTKEVKNIQVTARYLPADYLAYREYSSSDQSYDSILKLYRCSLSFQVTLQADKSDKVYGNLQYYGVASQEEHTARVRYLSFNVDDFIFLEHNEKTYVPVLSHFEGFDPVSNRLTFQVVFNIDEYNCGKPTKDFQNLVLTLDDPFWDIGKNNFEFTCESLVRIPKLEF